MSSWLRLSSIEHIVSRGLGCIRRGRLIIALIVDGFHDGVRELRCPIGIAFHIMNARLQFVYMELRLSAGACGFWVKFPPMMYQRSVKGRVVVRLSPPLSLLHSDIATRDKMGGEPYQGNAEDEEADQEQATYDRSNDDAGFDPCGKMAGLELSR